MINDQQLSAGAHREAGDLQRGVGDLLLPGELLSIVACRPDLAGGVVAVDVGAVELGQLSSVVDHAAGERARLAVVVLDGGWNEGGRAELAVQVEGMVTLVDAPAVVVAPVQQVDGLPEILAVVADPDLPGLRVHGHPPGVAQAEGPAFSPRVFHRDEGVVLRDRVGQLLAGLVDIDSQDGTVEVGDVLAGEIHV